MGTATCYWLAKPGVSAALLERTALAAGATGRNGGIVVAGPAESYPKAIAHLSHEAVRAILNVTYQSQSLLRQVLQEEAIARQGRTNLAEARREFAYQVERAFSSPAA